MIGIIIFMIILIIVNTIITNIIICWYLLMTLFLFEYHTCVTMTSIADTQDPLFQQSILKIDYDEFYTVNFTEKKPLGVVFER